MDVKQVDRSKKRPVLAALVMIILIVFPLVVIAGVLPALKERIKQLEGGEEDEARNY